MTNKLFYGDNLDVLREQIASDSVDLIYLDPAFNSKRYPRLQIITLAELFQGRKPDIPFVDRASVKRAKREEQDAGKQGNLL